jgi:predicted RND superfamily exporter protein
MPYAQGVVSSEQEKHCMHPASSPSLSQYYHFLTRHRIFWTLLLTGITVLAAVWSRHASLSARFTDYYPAHHPHVRLYQEFTEMLKMTNTVLVTVTVKEGTIYTAEVIGKIHRITVALIETRGVNPFEVMSLTHPRLKDIKIRNGNINILPVVNHPEEPQSPEALLRIKNAVYTNLGIRGIYVAPDDKTALIRAGFWDGMADPSALFARLQALVKQESDANTEIAFTGNLALAAWLINVAPRVLLLLVLSAGVAVLLTVLFSGLLSGVAVIVVNLIGALWGFAVNAILGFSLEPLALLILFPLCARGFMLTLGWHARLRHEYQRVSVPFAEQENRAAAGKRTAVALWRPLTAALCVDSAAFVVLLFSDVPALRALGGLGVGWLGGFICVLWLFLPLWATWLPPRAGLALPPSRLEQLMARLAGVLHSSYSPSVAMYSGIAVVSIVGVLAAIQLQAGRAMMGTTLFYPTHPYNRAFALVSEKFIGINQLIAIAYTREGSAFRSPHALQALEAFQHYMAEDEHFGGAVAITNIVKSITRMFHEGIPKWEMIPDDIDSTGQVIFRIVTAAATPSEVERFLSTDFHTTAVTLFYRTYSPALVERVLARAQAFAAQNGTGVEFRLGGGILGILAAIHAAVESNYWSTFGTLLGLTAVGGLWGLGKVRAVSVVVLTLILSQAAILILLWVANIDLNLFTFPVLVVSFGMPLLPAFFVWTRPAEGSAFVQARVLTTVGLLLALSAAIWLFSPLRLQAEMGFFLLLFVLLSNTLLPLQLPRLGTMPLARAVELDSHRGSASITSHESPS